LPWTLLGFLLLLVALGVGVWYVLRWRRRLRRAELAAVAARARRDTERRILGRRPVASAAVANGHGTASAPSPDPGPAEVSAKTEVSASTEASTEAATSGGTEDSGTTPAGSPTE
jgi:hypothetical protein